MNHCFDQEEFDMSIPNIEEIKYRRKLSTYHENNPNLSIEMDGLSEKRDWRNFMRKWCLVGCVWILFVCILLGCVTTRKNLTRVDYKQIRANGTYTDIEMLTDKKKLENIELIFSTIKWEKNVAVKRTRKEDIKATLFYKDEENMIERLYEYEIWFHDDIKKAILIGDNDEQRYAMLNKEQSMKLQKLFNDEK